jgi:uncharacterized membrane protein HdeD (DUF308 family)
VADEKEIDMAATDTLNPDRRPDPRRYRHANGWAVAWGVLLVISGVLAIAVPVVAAYATALIFGWLLLISGIFEMAHAVQTRHHNGFGWNLAAGILTLLLGLVILFVPLAGVASLALLVGAFLFVGGIARIVLAFKLRPGGGWGWVLLDGLVSLVIAVLIAIGWPANSIAFIGILTGIWLIFAGIWRIVLRPAAPA